MPDRSDDRRLPAERAGRGSALVAEPEANGHARVDSSTLTRDAGAPAAPATERPSTAPAPERPAAPAARPESDAAVPAAPAATPAQPTKKTGGIGKLIRNLVLLVLAVAVIATAGTVGYRWYEDSILYVSTDNAQVAGAMIQVGGLEAGRVVAVNYDVGSRINQNDVVGQLAVPVPVTTLPNGASRQEFIGTTDSRVDVRSPVSGVVVARSSNPGDTVAAGQSLLTVVDPTRLWITANVEETQARKLQPGQPVQVHIDNLGVDLPGHVAAVAQASAQSFSVLPQQNFSGNYTKVTQLQPVKILLDQTDPRLAIGTSAEVKIQVAS